MRKNKLTIGLITSFIGALALTSCGSTPAVTEDDKSVMSLVGYNGETNKIEINTDLFYGKYSNSSDGTKLYYEAVLEALVRFGYEKLSGKDSSLKSYQTLVEEAESKVTSSKQTANENAENNDTKFDEEWDKILESYNCEDEDDLKEYYLYDLEKTELSDKYFKQHEDKLMTDYIGVDSNWQQVESVKDGQSLYPYHILHVLVKLDAEKSNYVRGAISSDNAKKLWTVVRKLIDGNYTFEGIASTDSDDSGSKAKFGDVDIMTTKTSFYNEFKLGIYAYDALLSEVNSEGDVTHKNSKIYEGLGLNSAAEVTTQTTSTSITKELVKDLIKDEMEKNVVTPVKFDGAYTIPTVPYEVFQRISDLADEEKIDNADIEAGAASLPRNVLYNQFLNFHSPFIITGEDIEGLDKDAAISKTTFTTVNHNFAGTTGLLLDKPNFKNMTIGGVTKPVLVDSHGDVVIGVRSEAGIHFMVMRKSIFYNTNAASDKQGQTLENYYTTKTPTEEGYPSGGETFVNMKTTTDQSYYSDRADTIKSAAKSSDFDAAYDYRIYEELVQFFEDEEIGVHFFDEDENGYSVVKDNIEKYIELLRESNLENSSKTLNESWASYLLQLRYQNQVRAQKKAMVPTTCAYKLIHGNKALFDKDGDCYVK